MKDPVSGGCKNTLQNFNCSRATEKSQVSNAYYQQRDILPNRPIYTNVYFSLKAFTINSTEVE